MRRSHFVLIEKACFGFKKGKPRHAFSVSIRNEKNSLLLEKEVKYMHDTYEQTLEYLLNIPKFAAKTTKENLLLLLERLGNPHTKKKAIHVAGTNGKGSTCAFMSQILLEEGFHVGLFTSPHLIDLEERFQIDGKNVKREIFLECFKKFKEAQDVHIQEGNPHVSFFEAVFIIGTLIFQESDVDYVIYETGLGGRLDATNVLLPEVCVITSIGLDHMQILGNTIEEIAAEKAGIIKESVPVIYLSNTKASETIHKKAVEKKAKEIKFSKEFIKIQKKDEKYIDFCFQNGYIKYVDLKLKTCAEYQVENASLAILAIHQLIPTVSERAIRQGVNKMRWSCRMEEVLPEIYIDGAHNEPAIRRFIETVKEQKKEKSLLFAVVKDKDYKAMIQLLVQSSVFQNVFITFIGGERGVNSEQIGKQFLQAGQKNVSVIHNSKEAFKCARRWQQQEKNRVLYCAGSLYLAGELYEQIKKEREKSNDQF